MKMSERYISDDKLTPDEIDKTMLNGYFYLIHNETIDEAFTRNGDEKIFYPFRTENVQRIDILPMIKHFASEKYQEYEKCHELKKIYDNWNHRQGN